MTWRTLRVRREPTTSQLFQWRRSGSIVEAQVYGDAPLLKQPFWDIAPIPVLLAPGAELTRRGIHLYRELQLPRPHFEFSR